MFDYTAVKPRRSYKLTVHFPLIIIGPGRVAHLPLFTVIRQLVWVLRLTFRVADPLFCKGRGVEVLAER